MWNCVEGISASPPGVLNELGVNPGLAEISLSLSAVIVSRERHETTSCYWIWRFIVLLQGFSLHVWAPMAMSSCLSTCLQVSMHDDYRCLWMLVVVIRRQSHCLQVTLVTMGQVPHLCSQLAHSATSLYDHRGCSYALRRLRRRTD